MNDLESTTPRRMSYHFLIKLADIAKREFPDCDGAVGGTPDGVQLDLSFQ